MKLNPLILGLALLGVAPAGITAGEKPADPQKEAQGAITRVVECDHVHYP